MSCKGCAGVFQLPNEKLSEDQLCKHCVDEAYIQESIDRSMFYEIQGG